LKDGLLEAAFTTGQMSISYGVGYRRWILLLVAMSLLIVDEHNKTELVTVPPIPIESYLDLFTSANSKSHQIVIDEIMTAGNIKSHIKLEQYEFILMKSQDEKLLYDSLRPGGVMPTGTEEWLRAETTHSSKLGTRCLVIGTFSLVKDNFSRGL